MRQRDILYSTQILKKTGLRLRKPGSAQESMFPFPNSFLNALAQAERTGTYPHRPSATPKGPVVI